ncbi:MAG: GntR family transcriptional regulator [Gammaproteobacteria bacterium]|nr:GntR family transcriptional regulator [Gammaproteobacteria bacterium]MCH9763369.1 GntR family transcriptional regulator [Gammaproteobacteria bacterium]
MIKIGQLNELKVIKAVEFGVYLDGDDKGEILLPTKVVPEGTQPNDILNVFIYFDSEDRLIATTVRPRAQVGDCAFLKVVDVNHVGAFLDWGLDKDLLVPRPEQSRPMEKGKSYLVYLKQAHDGRVFASSKLDYFLDKTAAHFKVGDEVELFIAEATDLGSKVIINHKHWGLIYSDDVFQPLHYGQKTRGYIKTIRDDGKIDVTLRKTGQKNRNDLGERILAELKRHDGFLGLHDKSPSFEIQRVFNDSKKSFKSAIGQLYKQGLIKIEANGIRLA